MQEIIAFCGVCGFLFLVVRVIHPTRKEFMNAMDKQREDFFRHLQTKESCRLYHNTQDVRNHSFTNTMVEIKEEIKEIRKDIKEAINHLMEKK